MSQRASKYGVARCRGWLNSPPLPGQLRKRRNAGLCQSVTLSQKLEPVAAATTRAWATIGSAMAAAAVKHVSAMPTCMAFALTDMTCEGGRDGLEASAAWVVAWERDLAHLLG